MFKKINSIETAFRLTRFTCLLIVVLSFAFSGYMAYYSNRKIAQAYNRIYVIAAGTVLEAVARDRKENIPAEARRHIQEFHQEFFALAPDEKAINTNISRALYLADGSAKKMYDDLKENGYYAGIISGNISQEIVIDSIALNSREYPFHFTCYAKQRIIRATAVTTRSLISEGWLRNTARSDNNVDGFLIERFAVLENKDLKVEAR